MNKIDKENFIRVENPDFIEFVRELVEAVNLGYGAVELGSDDYPQNFGGLVYTCKLYRTEVKGIEIQEKVDPVATLPEEVKAAMLPPILQGTQNDAQKGANDAHSEEESKKPGRPKGSKNPRYDRGLKF